MSRTSPVHSPDIYLSTRKKIRQHWPIPPGRNEFLKSSVIIKSTHFTCVLLLLLYPKLWPLITPWIVNWFWCNWCQKKEAQKYYNLRWGFISVRVLLQVRITRWNLLLLLFLFLLFFILADKNWPDTPSETTYQIVSNSSLLYKMSKSTVLIHIFAFFSSMTLTPGQIQGHQKIKISSDSDVLFTQNLYQQGHYKNVTLTLKFEMTLNWEASKVKCM